MGHGGKRREGTIKRKEQSEEGWACTPVWSLPAARGPLESLVSPDKLLKSTACGCVGVTGYKVEFGADSNTNRTITQHGHRRTDCT